MSTLRALAIVLAFASSACAPPRLKLPEGPGSPLSDYSTVFETATAACRDIRTLTAELGLSGRALGQRVRGRALIGLESPSSVRIEGVAPFGAPLFILAARNNQSILFLPRENRVLEGEPPRAVLEALAGVDLGPADLLAILSSCVSHDARALDGSLHGKWASIRLEDGTTMWLEERAGARRLRAATRGTLRVEYGEPGTSGPTHIWLTIRRADGRHVDLRLALSQVETNAPMDPAAFTVSVPPDADPLTLDELRRLGPLSEPAHRSAS